MADSSGGARMPQSFGEKLSFSLPVIIVTLILSVGVSFGLVAYLNGSTREELTVTMNKAVGDEKQIRVQETSELKKKNDELQSDIVKVGKTNEDLVKANGLLKTELTTVKGDVAANKAEYKTFVDSQAKTDSEFKGEFIETKGSINKVETRVKYIEDKIKNIEKIEADVNSLKGDTASLKQEYAVLHTDLEVTKKKADITDKDLTDLSDRARQFQMRVLVARASQAGEEARKADIKNLLDRLGEVEGANK